MSTVLIAGGAGFIGSHLCAKFLADGHKVICVDNLLTGQKANIEAFERNRAFSFIQVDITKPFDVPVEIDYILNFASPASPVDFYRLPVETLKAGSLGTLNLIELAKRKRARFLMASTSEVYGDPTVHPQVESYCGNVNTIGQRAVYDEAKRFSETVVTTYGKKFGLQVRIARIFNTYGPRMRPDDGRLVPNFLTQAIAGKPLTVFGDGTQTRSLCYVDDLVEGLVRLLHSDYSAPVNLGNPEEITILEFAQTIRKLFNPNLEISFKPLPAGDPKTRQPDITLAKTLLGWQPKTSLEEGLKKTWEYLCKLLKEEKENVSR